VALANGTVALELALCGLGIGSGDEVIVTCRSFMASASAVVLRGAVPVFVDVEPESQNIGVATIRPYITDRTKAIIAVHLAGWPCDMSAITALAAEHDLKVIEDCAQAHGAFFQGRPVGSFGHAAVFSFCHDKIMTTGGEGGMLLTNDADLWERAWSYKDHGKSYHKMTRHASGAIFQYVHDSFGTNWRMTEMQAALGRCQLVKLPSWVKLRRQHATRLNACFREMPALRVTEPGPEYYHSYYKYYVFVRPERLKPTWHRDRIAAAIRAEGIPCYSGSCPQIYLEKAFVDAGLQPPGPMPVAQMLGETSLMFLVHPTLEEEEIRDTCRAVEKVMAAATAQC